MVPRRVQITDVSSTPPDEVPTRRHAAAPQVVISGDQRGIA